MYLVFHDRVLPVVLVNHEGESGWNTKAVSGCKVEHKASMVDKLLLVIISNRLGKVKGSQWVDLRWESHLGFCISR